MPRVGFAIALIVALILGATGGALVFTLLSSGDPPTATAVTSPRAAVTAAATSVVASATPTAPAAPSAGALPAVAELRAIARRAARPGERVRIAVTASTSKGAVTAAASSGQVGTRFRLWS